MDKQIRIKAVLDNSEFNDQVQKVEQKLQQMQKSQQGFEKAQSQHEPQSKMGQYTKSFYSDYSQESISKMREAFNLNARQMQHQSKELTTKQRDLQGLEKIETKMTSEQRQRVDLIKEEIKSIKEKGQLLLQQNTAISEQAKSMGADLAGFKGVGSPPPTAPAAPPRLPGGGGGDDDGGDIGILQKMMSKSGALPAALMALAFGAGKVGTSVWQETAERERNISMAQGRATELGITPLREQMQDRGVENLIFSEERMKGFDVMGKEMESRRSRDVVGAITPGAEGSRFGAMVAQGTAGVVAGGIAGSMIPGFGTVAGGVLGGLGGAAMGLFGDKQTRGAMFGTEEYLSRMTEEGLEKQKQVEAAEKLRNFQRTMGYEELQKNMPMYREMQREFGIERATDPEGMVGQMLQSGMTKETGLQLGTQLMRSSGITTKEEDVGDIKQMQLLREGGLTNIGGVAGRIKGLEAGFGERTQEQVLARILQAAVRGGINESEMVEEQRQFLEVTTRLASERGVSADVIADELARGMIVPSARGLSEAQSAMQMRETESSRLSGPQGAFKWAFAGTERGQEMLGGLSENFELLSTFLGMPLSQMDESNPMVQRIMDEMGVQDVTELKRRKREFDLRGATPRGETYEQMRGLGEKAEDMTAEQFQESIQRGGELHKQYTDVVTALGVERGEQFRALPFGQQMSYLKGKTDIGEQGLGGGITGEQMLGDTAARGAAAPSTKFEEAAAADQLANMNRLNLYIDEFANTAQKHAESTRSLLTSTTDVDDAMKIFQEAIKNGAQSLGELQQIMMAIKNFSETGDTQQWETDMGKARDAVDAPNVTGNTTGSGHFRGMQD